MTAARFFAALLVIFFHYPDKKVLFPHWLISFGNEAVVFFFILSGFILTYVHVQLTGKRLDLNVSKRQFLISRLSRILPAYLVGLALAAPFFIYGFLIAGVISPASFFSGITLIPLLLQSWWPPATLLWNAPAWSLSVEWFFYLSFPALINAMGSIEKGRLVVFSYLLVICAGVSRYIFMQIFQGLFWHNFISYFPLMHLPQFVLGIALGCYYLSSRQNPSLNRLLLHSGLYGVVLLMVFKPDNEWLSNPAIISVPFAFLIYGAAGLRSDLLNNAAGRILNTLGEASYSLYILHIPVLMLWRRAVIFTANHSSMADFCSYLLVTVVLSLLTFYTIEQPGRKWLFNWLSASFASKRG